MGKCNGNLTSAKKENYALSTILSLNRYLITINEYPMSLESGRKFGYYASLMNIILPIESIGVAVAIIFP